ncbi:MAG: transposase [Saprospiraceae bacterium]|nr:transposase [Saprospiraceae bacterium]
MGYITKIRSENQIVSKACMVVLGINTAGQQDILSLRICERISSHVG